MLSLVLRTLIIMSVLIFGIRIMGKRTIGELQPYEFVITLAVADLACTPMQDVSVPLLYGIVPMTVLIVFHFFITMLTSKSIRFRKFLNGKPFIVINADGIDCEVLTKLNVSVNDLLELIRQQGCFSVPEISYGIIETNGKLSVMKNENAAVPPSVPINLIMEGKILSENLQKSDLTAEKISGILDEQSLRQKDVVLMTSCENSVFIQPRNQKYRTICL